MQIVSLEDNFHNFHAMSNFFLCKIKDYFRKSSADFLPNKFSQPFAGAMILAKKIVFKFHHKAFIH